MTVGVAAHPSLSRVDDVADPWDGEGSLGNIGREHDSPHGPRLEDSELVAQGQARVERQHLGLRKAKAVQRVRAFPDLALAREEDEHIALALFAVNLRECSGEPSLHVTLRRRAVAHFDGVAPSRHLDDRGVAEKGGESAGIDGGGAHDNRQVAAPAHETLEMTEQHVDVEAALVRLVDDDGAVFTKSRVRLDFGEQNAVGHELETAAPRNPTIETHLVAHQFPDSGSGFRGDPRRHTACRDAPGLSVSDASSLVRPLDEAHFRKLGGLPRTGIATDDHHAVLAQGPRNLFGMSRDRKRGFDRQPRSALSRYGTG